MDTISLEGLQFFAHHGFYEEERKIGNRYSVDIFLRVDFKEAAKSDELHQTVNYEDIYRIVKEEMDISSKLLENVLYRILAKIKTNFPQVHWVKASVSKFNPPIGGICERARVTIEEDFRA